MEYSFLFPLMQKLWKYIKKCKTYSRKATGFFFPDTVWCESVVCNVAGDRVRSCVTQKFIHAQCVQPSGSSRRCCCSYFISTRVSFPYLLKPYFTLRILMHYIVIIIMGYGDNDVIAKYYLCYLCPLFPPPARHHVVGINCAMQMWKMSSSMLAYCCLQNHKNNPEMYAVN